MNKIIVVGIVGFIAGLLVAPKKGTETRKSIKKFANQVLDDGSGILAEKLDRSRELLDEARERGQEIKTDVDAAVLSATKHVKHANELAQEAVKDLGQNVVDAATRKNGDSSSS